MSKLDHKVALVTGGAQGIGLAVAERYLAEGANVVIADIDKEAGYAAQEKLAEQGEVRFRYCDVSKKLDIHNLVATSINEFGHIDILVNNAGMVVGAEFLDLSEEDFDRVLNVNLKGAFLCGQAIAKQMVQQIGEGSDPGAIINMSSVNAVMAIANQVPYTVSKGGLNQLTKVMALALAPHGIRVNGIGPGSIMTKILESVANNEEARHKILSRTPLGRIGEPEEVASIATFLASSDASYITGQTLYADGGRLGLNYTVPVET